MIFVGSAARDGVDDATHGAAEFSRIAVADHLEFLHGIFRDLRGDTGTAGVLAIETVGGVVAVGEEGVSGGNAVETDQTKGAISDNAGRQEHESVGAPTIDGQVVNLLLVDQIGNTRLGIFHSGNGGFDAHAGSGSGQIELDIQVDGAAHFDCDVLGLVFGESGFIDLHRVTRGRHQRRRVENTSARGFHSAADTL